MKVIEDHSRKPNPPAKIRCQECSSLLQITEGDILHKECNQYCFSQSRFMITCCLCHHDQWWYYGDVNWQYR